MTTLVIRLDDTTQVALRKLSEREGSDIENTAARLLARAVRAARPRRTFDVETLKCAYAEFAAEDLALAESARDERTSLLTDEDAA